VRVVSHSEAEQELEAAAVWYAKRQAGLGDDFLDEFERTLLRIVAEPDRWHKIVGQNRKLNFQRFPYAIVNQIRGDDLLHCGRDAPPPATVLLNGSRVRLKSSQVMTGALISEATNAPLR
jgi:hypothetical protein